MIVAPLILVCAALYAAAGLALGIAFLLFGLARRDAASVGAYAFRPLLLPGLAALWPLVLWRWVRG